MVCTNCGTYVPDGVKFCPGCGAKQTAAADNQSAAGYQPTDQSAGYQQTDYQQSGYQQTDYQQSGYHPTDYQAGYQPTNYQPINYQPTNYQTPAHQSPATPQQPMQSPPAAKKKISGGLIAVIIIVPVLIAAGLCAYFLTPWFKNPNDPTIESATPTATPAVTDVATETPTDSPSAPPIVDVPNVSYTYQSKTPQATIKFTTIDSIFPANYRSLEALATFTGYSDYGDVDVIIEVEVPGFTQKYKQKVTLGRKVEKLRIIPPLVTGSIDLNSEKIAQLVYSATNADTGKILVQESKNIKLYSKFDIVFDEIGHPDAFTDNILAWMTPDAPEIVQLKRDAIDYLSEISGGDIEMLVGYQDVGILGSKEESVWAQAVAIQGAISDIAKVRYNSSWFSMDAQQRVLMPVDVLKTRSGVCVETSLLMASALQSADMHCMLIFPPGHTQVALECWRGSGEYFLIETTVLPMERNMQSWEYVVKYMTKEEWVDYIENKPCYVVDCDLAAKLGIRALSN